MMPLPSTNDIAGSNYRHTASRSRSSAGSRQYSRRPGADEAGPSHSGALEGIYWDNEDDSFEVPDFHFDWGVAKEKTRTEMGMGSDNGLDRLHISQTTHKATSQIEDRYPARTKTDTPSPMRHPNSAQSSASSAHVMSLTDASTASSSSLFPTPPNPILPMDARSLLSRTSEAGGSGSGRPGRTYGVRGFQRVVSAPLTHQKYEARGIGAASDDISVSCAKPLQYPAKSFSYRLLPLHILIQQRFGFR